MKDDSESGTRVDASQSDKRSYMIQTIDGEKWVRLDDVEDLIARERSEVQQRSGDVLLPCPFCGGLAVMENEDGSRLINHAERCWILFQPEFLARFVFAEEVEAWNTRASGSRQLNTDE